MIASDLLEQAQRLSADADAQIERLLRAAENCHGLDTQRLMLLAQVSIMAYGLEAVATALVQLNDLRIGEDLP